LEAVCRKKARSKAQAQGVKLIDVLEMVKAAPCRNSEVQKLQVPIHINGKAFTLELDTAAGGNFISTRVWAEQAGQAETSTGSVALPFGKEASVADHWSFYRRGQVR